MDMASKFSLLRTSTLLFEILSLLEFFYEENACHVTQFFLVCQASLFPGQEVESGVPLQSFVSEFPPFFPPVYY